MKLEASVVFKLQDHGCSIALHSQYEKFDHFTEFLSGAVNMTEPQVQQAMAKAASEQLGVDMKT